MVETNNSGLGICEGSSPNTNISTHTNPAYLTTAMLLGTQGCGYLGQRIQNHLRERSEIGQQQQQHQQQRHTASSTPTSLFTIDSILASAKPASLHNDEATVKLESPSCSPPSSQSSPVRPTRVPAMLHPGLHLGHLAAAAASGFGTPSDFLGEYPWDSHQ